jgi:hypothetical protein
MAGILPLVAIGLKLTGSWQANTGGAAAIALSSVACLAIIIAAVVVYVGRRAWLTVSPDGVLFTGKRDGRGTRELLSIRWSEVTDFRVTESKLV